MQNKRRAAAKGKLSTAQIVAGAKLPAAKVKLCLRGDLVVAHQAANDAFEKALLEHGESLAGTPPELEPLAAAVDAIQEEMAAYTLVVTMQGLPGRKYQELKEQHPPRKDDEGLGVHPDDRQFGVDVSTFFPALIPLITVDPADLTAELWNELLDEKLTDGQIQELCVTAYNVNEARLDVPFSPAVLKILRSSGRK
jgi:hypothetical protein